MSNEGGHQVFGGSEKRRRQQRRALWRALREAKATVQLQTTEMESLMTSERQIAANRANARRSTGPRTADGKAVSCLNATTHGLTAKLVVLPAEDQAAFEAFQRGVFKSLKPEDEMQADVVAQIAGVCLRRVPYLAAAITACRLHMRATAETGDFSGLNGFGKNEDAALALLQKEFPGHSAEELFKMCRFGEMLMNNGLVDMTRLLDLEDKLNRQLDRLLKRLKDLIAMRAVTIEHEAVDAATVECDAEDAIEDVTADAETVHGAVEDGTAMDHEVEAEKDQPLN